jgi:hypothetical protein
MKKINILFMLILILCLSEASVSQVNLKKLGQNTMGFLEVPVSPKAAAMGNAYTAVSNDAVSVFYNPAGLANIQSGFNAFISYTKWIADINYSAAAIAKSFGNMGTFALSALIVDYGEIQGARLLSQADPQGYELTENVDVSSFAFGLGYGKQISDKFSIGGLIQIAGQKLGNSELVQGTVDNNVSTWILNFGIKYYPITDSDFRFAMAIRNFSQNIKYEEVSAQLPMSFMFGVAWDVMELFSTGNRNHAFLLSTEFLHPNDYTERINLGGEYNLAGLIAIRGGYEFNRDVASWSTGIGLTPSVGNKKLEVNYSYSNFDVFDGVNRFSLVVSF